MNKIFNKFDIISIASTIQSTARSQIYYISSDITYMRPSSVRKWLCVNHPHQQDKTTPPYIHQVIAHSTQYVL